MIADIIYTAGTVNNVPKNSVTTGLVTHKLVYNESSNLNSSSNANLVDCEYNCLYNKLLNLCQFIDPH